MTALAKLEKFATFSKGWAFGEGYAFPVEVIEAAKKVLEFYDDDYNSDVFPCRDASVIVVIYISGRELEFRIGFECDRSDVVTQLSEGGRKNDSEA